MDLGIAGKTALVAASSTGLGKAVAWRLAEEGARVAVSGRNIDSAQRAAAEIRAATDAEVIGIAGDVTRNEDIESLCEAFENAFGGADILINNAGGPSPGRFDDLSDDQWQHAVDLNLLSAVRLTRRCLPHMRQQRWGRVINITSYSVKQPVDQLMLSNSVRLGVIGWSKTLANEVGADGVLVNSVCPGWTETDRVGELLEARSQASGQPTEDIRRAIVNEIPLARMGQPDEFADIVAFLASERASYITGTAIAIDGGIVQSPL